MHIQHNVDLAPFTTFGIHAVAESFVEVSTIEELRKAIAWAQAANTPFKVLGSGSNILVTDDVAGLIIRIRIMGRTSTVEASSATIHCGAGENWHSIVQWSVENGWGGLENLALIPGTVGAAPMQNIGAYGTEQSSCFVELQALDVTTGIVATVTKDECAFGYRESIFKRDLRHQMVITSVTYRLATAPVVNVSYRDVAEELHSCAVIEPQVADVFDAVVAIRQRKLPDPRVIGNAGSFFKNPVVDLDTYAQLVAAHPTMPSYAQADGTFKLAAAWLIDQCGWKGYRSGDAGVHDRQALVLVNHGNAVGSQLLELSMRIQHQVQDQFGVDLEREINVW